jgi:hypothetical protein
MIAFLIRVLTFVTILGCLVFTVEFTYISWVMGILHKGKFKSNFAAHFPFAVCTGQILFLGSQHLLTLIFSDEIFCSTVFAHCSR